MFSKIKAEISICIAKALQFLEHVVRGTRSTKVRAVVAAVVIALSSSIICAVNAASYTAAVAVVCNGKTVGYVADMTTAAAVEQGVNQLVYGSELELIKLGFSEELVREDSISEVSGVLASALDGVGELEKRTGLIVDGVLTAVASSTEEMEGLLNVLVAKYTANGAEFVSYQNEIEIKDIYITADSIALVANTEEDVLNGKTNVSVLTTGVESYEEEVPFETKVSYDKTKFKDYKKVTQKGKKGVNRITAKVTYCNGEKVSSECINTEVVTEPQTEKITKGSYTQPLVPVKPNLTTGNAEFVFPCEVTSGTYISSYWGDGRGHKGVDIASPKGSEIYAAANGVVTVSGWGGDYGKYVIIQHDDGVTKTLYSHNSSNLVKVGDRVTAGQVIAKVGATGNATGNHVHFSVMINGKMVNPASYIGLK